MGRAPLPSGSERKAGSGVPAWLLLACLCALSAMIPDSGWAQAPRRQDAKRLALVIGVNGYPKLPGEAQLQKAVADAEAMADALKLLNFRVELARNPDRLGILAALDRVKAATQPGDTVLVFFAGHGIAFQGTNLLLPADMPPVDPSSEALVRGASISESQLIEELRGKGAGLTILVLDACRDNPIEDLARKQAAAQGRPFRALPGMSSAGLNTRPTSGVFSIYSAGIGQRALDRLSTDGDGDRNSVFTRVFVRRIAEPGRHLTDLMEDVRDEVAQLAATELDPQSREPHHQNPAFYNETQGGRIFLAGRPNVAAAPPPATLSAPVSTPEPTDPALLELIRSTGDRTILERLTRSQDPAVREAARRRLAGLSASPEAPSSASRGVGQLVEACDLLAAGITDPDRPAKIRGVGERDIDAAAAVPACRSALEAATGDGTTDARVRRRLAYQLGRALERSKLIGEARQHYESAAQAGSGGAMYALGLLSDRGELVPQDYGVARGWYEKGAAAGSSAAMVNLGFLYARGRGVAQDYGAAREWYAKASILQNAVGMRHLGELYERGLGIRQDHIAARTWYGKSASGGNSDGMYDLGRLLFDGLGGPKDEPGAKVWYEKAAAGGNVTAMPALGLMFAAGRGTAQDYAAARGWYEKGAARGSLLAMYRLGGLYQSGLGVQQDHAAARRWHSQAAAGGHLDAMMALAALNRDGLGGPQDHAVARELFGKAAARGHAPAMTSLGYMYSNGLGGPADPVAARDWYEKAAAKGDSVAMRNLGIHAERGRVGGKPDFAVARGWYEKAAEKGDAYSLAGLGRLYFRGLGVRQDYAAARDWFEKAAARGNGWAMAQLGDIHADGLGVPKNVQTAREWYEKGAARDEHRAMFSLGVFHENGTGVPRNPEEARRWYTKAAEGGYASAMYALAVLHENGTGVARDPQEARRWYEKAAALGHKPSQARLADLSRRQPRGR